MDKILAWGERGPGFDSQFHRAATISEIDFLLLPCRIIAEISLKRYPRNNKPTNQASDVVVVIPSSKIEKVPRDIRRATHLQQPVLARVTA